MKKLFYLFLLMFLFPLSVKADSMSPRIVSYDAIVINPEGAEAEIVSCRDLIFIWNETGETELIEYNTKIKVLQEVEGRGFFTYNDKCASIDLKDIRSYNNVKLDDFQKFEEKKKLLTYGDVYLYNGPSEVYGKVNNEVKIPTGEIIEYEYHDGYWCYVTYNGVSGWIQMRAINEKFASQEEKDKVKVAHEIKEKVILNSDIEYLYVGPYSDEKVNVNIPKNTILDSKFAIRPYIGPATTLYIEYNGVSGWLTNEHKFSSLYTDIILNSNGATLYEEGNTNSEILSTIPYNVEVNVFLTNYVKGFKMIEYKGLIGYVKVEGFEETIGDIPIEPEVPEEDKEANIPNESENPDNNEKEENNNGMDSSWHIKNVILTVFFCIILALVTLVIILLINKKKKTKEVEIIKIEDDKNR